MYIYTNTYTCIYMYTYIYTNICIYMYMCVYVYMYVCTYVYIYICGTLQCVMAYIYTYALKKTEEIGTDLSLQKSLFLCLSEQLSRVWASLKELTCILQTTSLYISGTTQQNLSISLHLCAPRYLPEQLSRA